MDQPSRTVLSAASLFESVLPKLQATLAASKVELSTIDQEWFFRDREEWILSRLQTATADSGGREIQRLLALAQCVYMTGLVAAKAHPTLFVEVEDVVFVDNLFIPYLDKVVADIVSEVGPQAWKSTLSSRLAKMYGVLIEGRVRNASFVKDIATLALDDAPRSRVSFLIRCIDSFYFRKVELLEQEWSDRPTLRGAWGWMNRHPGSQLAFDGRAFVGSSLIHADLHGLPMSKCNFQTAVLDLANLEESSLRGADFMAASLIETNLRRADLRNARFLGANLQGADLTGAIVEGAILSNANLSGTKLIDVSILHCDLSNASLVGALLTPEQRKIAVEKGANLEPFTPVEGLWRNPTTEPFVESDWPPVRSIDIFIRRGSAPPSLITEILGLMSDLHRGLHGSGLKLGEVETHALAELVHV